MTTQEILVVVAVALYLVHLYSLTVLGVLNYLLEKHQR